MARGLTPKQARFTEEFLIDLNASAAAKRAGYTGRWIGSQAWQLLQKTPIQEAIHKAAALRSKRTLITADMVLAGLYRIAFFDPADIFNDDGTLKKLSSIPKPIRQAIAGMKFSEGKVIEIKLPEKVRAYELLGKHRRLWTDVVKHEGDINIRERIACGRRRALGKTATARRGVKSPKTRRSQQAQRVDRQTGSAFGKKRENRGVGECDLSQASCVFNMLF